MVQSWNKSHNINILGPGEQKTDDVTALPSDPEDNSWWWRWCVFLKILYFYYLFLLFLLLPILITVYNHIVWVADVNLLLKTLVDWLIDWSMSTVILFVIPQMAVPAWKKRSGISFGQSRASEGHQSGCGRGLPFGRALGRAEPRRGTRVGVIGVSPSAARVRGRDSNLEKLYL